MLLDLVITNRDGLVGKVKVEGNLSCSDHEMLEFMILQGESRTKSRTTALDFKRAHFGLFRDLTAGIPWSRP